MLSFILRQFRGRKCQGVIVDAEKDAQKHVSEFCLIHIPAAVLGPRLLPFLTIKHAVRLDSAVINRDLRKHLHDAFVGTSIFVPVGTEQFSWFAARKCSTEYFSVHDRCSLTIPMITGPSMKSIKALRLAKPSISAHVLSTLLHNCEHLTTLYLQCTDVDWAKCTINRTLNMVYLDIMCNSTVTDEFMTMVLEHSPQLQVLNICRGKITPRILHTVAHHCTDLRSLYAWHAFESRDETVVVQYEAAMCDLLKSCTLLHTLDASVYTSAGFFSTDICTSSLLTVHLSGTGAWLSQDTAIVRMAQCCPSIQDLSLSNFRCCGNTSLYAIAQYLPHLHTLCLFQLQCITDEGVGAILTACTKLNALQIYGCHNVALYSLTHTTGILTSLQLHTSDLDDDTLLQATQHNSHLQKRSITMGKDGDGDQFFLSPTCLSGAVVYLPHLREFHFCDCADKEAACISDTLLCALSQHCPLLASLILYTCTCVTDTGASALSSLHQLHTLFLHHCPKLGNRAVCAIAQGCPDLYKVSFVQCSGVSSEGACVLAQYCRKLEHVNLIVCSWIREYALLELIHNARYLKEVRVLKSFLLSNAVIAKLPQCRWEESAF